jgi:hypothetical protein
VYVEAPFYGRREDLAPNVEEMDEQFASPAKSKTGVEAVRLNRPVLPIEAVVYLVGTDGKAKLAPHGVGPVKLSWSASEPVENLDRQLEDDPKRRGYARSYVRTCLELEGGRLDATGNNCLQDYGGARQGGGTPGLFVIDHYPPYAGEAVGGNLSCRTAVLHDPKDKRFVPCIGRSGVMFRPSSIAGDAYQIHVHIDDDRVDTLPRPVRGTSGILAVWRRARVAAIVGWPARKIGGDALAELRQEYLRAFLDLDVSSVARVDVTQVITQRQYEAWMEEACKSSSLTKAPSKDLRPDTVIAGKPDEAMAASFKLITEASLGALAERMAPVLRARCGNGAVFVDYEPCTGVDMVPDLSCAAPNGFVFLNHRAQESLPFVLAHELGHCFWLMHARPTSSDRALIADHHLADRNCLMGYSTTNPGFIAIDPHRAVNTRVAHFCGKCNLKLRGWDVRAGAAKPLPNAGPELRLTWSRPAILAHPGDPSRPEHKAGLHVEVLGVPQGVLDGASTLEVQLWDASTQVRKEGLPVVKVERSGALLVPVTDFSMPDVVLIERGRPVEIVARATLDWKSDSPGGIVDSNAARLEVVPRVAFCGDLRDKDLRTKQEQSSITKSLAEYAFVDPLYFDADPNVVKWGAFLEGSFVYHHVSHGNQRCKAHDKRAFVPGEPSLAPTPRYPWWCRADEETCNRLDVHRDKLLNSKQNSSDVRWAELFSALIRADNKEHPMEGVFQWCITDDSKDDVVFTPADVASAKHAPRWLAFLNCCVVGWNETLPLAFLTKGTRYVLAWRCAVSGQGVGQTMARDVYAAWVLRGLDVAEIPAVFRAVAPRYAATEPVLFSSDGVLHCYEVWDTSTGSRRPVVSQFTTGELGEFYTLRRAEPPV